MIKSQDNLKGEWVVFQLSIAWNRPPLQALFNAILRSQMQLSPQSGAQAARAGIWEFAPYAAPNALNGVESPLDPVWMQMSEYETVGGYAGAIILAYDAMLQRYAQQQLGRSGLDVPAGALVPSKKLTTSVVLAAAGNNIRHHDQWKRFAATYSKPSSNKERDRVDQQNKSMIPLSRLLNRTLPIEQNVAANAALMDFAKRPSLRRA